MMLASPQTKAAYSNRATSLSGEGEGKGGRGEEEKSVS